MRLSLAVTAVAKTRPQTSPLLGRGSSTSRTLRTSGGPYAVQTTALTPSYTSHSYARPIVAVCRPLVPAQGLTAYLTAYPGQPVTRQDAQWHKGVRRPNT